MATLLVQEKVPSAVLQLPPEVEAVAATRTRDQVILSLANAWKRVVNAGPRRSPPRQQAPVMASANARHAVPSVANHTKLVFRHGQAIDSQQPAPACPSLKRWPSLTRYATTTTTTTTTTTSVSTPPAADNHKPKFWASPSRRNSHDDHNNNNTSHGAASTNGSPASMPPGVVASDMLFSMMGSENAHAMLLSMQDFIYNSCKNTVLTRLLEDETNDHNIQTLPAGEFAVHQLLASRVSEANDAAPTSAFYLVDLSLVVRQVCSWRQNLPLIEGTFSITANADPMILKTMAVMGIRLCCSSKGDLDALNRIQSFHPLVQDIKPCKTPSHLAAALSSGIRALTVDSVEEVSRIAHKAKAMGIATADLTLMVLMRGPEEEGFSLGASMDELLAILLSASVRSLQVVGIIVDTRHFSGSGQKGYVDGPVEAMLSSTVSFARRAVDLAKQHGTHLTKVHLLGLEKHLMGSLLQAHIGIAFPTSSGVSFSIDATQHLLDQSTSLATKIIGKRASVGEGETPVGYHYYLDDGCYGSLGDIFLLKKKLIPNPLFVNTEQEPNQSTLYPTTLWGPTCDGLDCIDNLTTLPEMEIGDWIYYRNVGSLTFSNKTNFNGLSGPSGMYCFSGVSYM